MRKGKPVALASPRAREPGTHNGFTYAPSSSSRRSERRSIALPAGPTGGGSSSSGNSRSTRPPLGADGHGQPPVEMGLGFGGGGGSDRHPSTVTNASSMSRRGDGRDRASEREYYRREKETAKSSSSGGHGERELSVSGSSRRRNSSGNRERERFSPRPGSRRHSSGGQWEGEQSSPRSGRRYRRPAAAGSTPDRGGVPHHLEHCRADGSNGAVAEAGSVQQRSDRHTSSSSGGNKLGSTFPRRSSRGHGDHRDHRRSADGRHHHGPGSGHSADRASPDLTDKASSQRSVRRDASAGAAGAAGPISSATGAPAAKVSYPVRSFKRIDSLSQAIRAAHVGNDNDGGRETKEGAPIAAAAPAAGRDVQEMVNQAILDARGGGEGTSEEDARGNEDRVAVPSKKAAARPDRKSYDSTAGNEESLVATRSSGTRKMHSRSPTSKWPNLSGRGSPRHLPKSWWVLFLGVRCFFRAPFLSRGKGLAARLFSPV